MTQSKPLQTTERSSADIQFQRKFWGVIAIAVLALLAYAYALSNLFKLEPTTAVYIKMAVYVIAMGLAVTSFILAIRRQVDLALTMIFYFLLIAQVANPATTQGRTLNATFTMLVMGTLMIGWLLPRSAWRRNAAFLAGAFILAWVFEWIDPPWRVVTVSTGAVGPAVAITFLVVLVALVTREAWFRNTIRSRFLTLSLGLTLLAAVVIAVVSVNSLLTAGEQAQETSSTVLQDQIQNTLRYQTDEIALRNNLILEKISLDAQDLARQATNIFENPNAFNTESFWVAEEHMFFGSEGQYVNGESDISTVFVPNTVVVNDRINEQLELLAFLDSALVPVFESDPNTVAVYFISKDEISWLHPNISLGQFVPPDFQATEDIFYSIGSPENNPERKVVWTPVYDDPAGQGLLVSTIAPVYANNRFMGVIGIDVSLANLTANIESEDFSGGAGAYAFLVDDDGRALALPEQGYRDLLGRERQPGEFGVDLVTSAQTGFLPLFEDMLTGEYGFQSVVIEDQEFYVAYSPLVTTDWHIASLASADKVLAPAVELRAELQELSNSLVFGRILPVGLIFLGLVVIGSLFFTNRLINPIEQLTEGAAKIGLGEWDAALPESELKEIGGLSLTLRTMASQLRSTLGSLEQRVADRTRNLELAAEVGRAVSQVRALDVMLRDACDLILKEFNLYYVQVYLVDPSASNLKLEAGTGSVGVELLGRGHNLPFDTNSINGRAAVEKQSVVIPDTSKSPTFRQNPLLPETRGEMAVPLVVADKVVGVLDKQSNQPGLLTEEVLPAFEALAGQMAVAVQNANLLAEAEQARAQVEAQARRLVREGWSEHLDAIHKPEQLGYVFAQNTVSPLADETQLPENGRAVSAPIAVTGEPLGSLVVELDDEARAEQTSELVNIVARQVAQQIENLRLLESAERYRAESERAARLQTIEGWQKYVEARAAGSLGYLYDTIEVRPQQGNGDADTSMFAMPLKAREEMIGKLMVEGLTQDDQESVDLVNAVAERLSAHIENLRLFEETRQGQLELDKRARQLSAVAEISNASSRELDIQKMLETVVHLTQRQFGLYHAHIFIFSEDTEALKIQACGWKEGDVHEGTHGTAEIPLAQEQSLVARAARTRQAVIVNNVLLEPGWLPNPLLPDTASELAVPLVIGDRLLGVLDVQSDRVNAFTDEDANIQTTLASQVATALQNARSFTQAQKQAEREAMLNVINQKIQSATSVESVLQIAARELGHALGAPMTVAQLSMKDKAS